MTNFAEGTWVSVAGGSSQVGITGLRDNDNLTIFFKSPVELHKQLF